jgi:transcriptional repressor NrdR
MICPYCKTDNDKVIDTRSSDGGLEIRRRRECLNCARRFTSYEKVDYITVKVIKKDGSEQTFDIRKVINSVEIACRKTQITDEEIKEIGDNIEKKSLEAECKEISSNEIGDMIMKELKKLDPVAYVRFSSVYREYTNVDQFISALQGIKKK